MACRTSAARLLGVAPNASSRHIQAAFRKKALETHPDRKGGSAAQFLAARDAADLLLRPAPAATAPPRAPQPSHTTDARAVAHRTIRSLDEELAAAFERMRTGPELHVDPETLRVAGADEFPKEFELDERNQGVDGPLLRLRHGDRVIGCVEADRDDKLRVSLFGRDVATAERSPSGVVSVRRGTTAAATLAPRPRTSFFDVADAFDTSGYTCVRVKLPGVTTTTWRSTRGMPCTVASVVRAWRPHRRWWPFGSDEESYASDGAAASTYVERRAGDDRALTHEDAPPPLDPALVVAKVAFQALDRERVRLGAFV